VEFLVWLLIAAAIIAMLAKRLRIPYTVSLVLGGLLLGIVRLPVYRRFSPVAKLDAAAKKSN
jgi:Kef-type K+ transport system membrane component KefB